MRLPVSLLNKYLKIDDLKVEELVAKLSEIGVETEEIINLADEIKLVKVGLVVKKEKHPNADKLNYCQLDVGGENLLNVVCGADNFKEGDKVPVALIGGVLPGGIKMKKTKIRGLTSEGMICSTVELGLEKEDTTCHGIMVLPDDAPVGKDFVDYIGLNDPVLVLELTANRGDLLGIKGIARDLAAKLKREITYPELAELGKLEGKMSKKVSIEAPNACNRYLLKTFVDVKNGESPEWLKLAILKFGLNPISYVVDLTNYILFETGQPMHAFDMDKLNGDIVVRFAKEGEKFKALDERELTLTSSDLVIADDKGPIALAGVIGGWDSQVDLNTKRIALEFAHFDPVLVRKTAKRYGYHTDSSHRFERFVDPEGVEFAAKRAVYFYKSLGKEEEGYLDLYPGKEGKLEVSLSLSKLNKIIGKEYSKERVEEILAGLGFSLLEDKGEVLLYDVPSYRRFDVQREIDLIEEVVRIDGYNNFEAKFSPVTQVQGGYAGKRGVIRRIKDILRGMNLDEAMSFSFGNCDYYLNFVAEDDLIELRNPLTEDFAVLRPYIFPNLLQAVKRNEDLGEKGFAFYEIGKVFSKKDSQDFSEKYHLSLLLSEESRDFFWNKEVPKNDFFTLKGIIENLSREFTLTLEWEASQDYPFLHPGISAKLLLNGKTIGFAGKIHPDIKEMLELKDDLYIAELSLEKVELKSQLLPSFSPFSKFPGAYRDLALVVPIDLPYLKVKEVIEKAGLPHLKRLYIFDYYEGKHVPEGYRSIAIRMFFQSEHKTLKDKEINKVFTKIEKTLEHKLGIKKREE